MVPWPEGAKPRSGCILAATWLVSAGAWGAGNRPSTDDGSDGRSVRPLQN